MSRILDLFLTVFVLFIQESMEQQYHRDRSSSHYNSQVTPSPYQTQKYPSTSQQRTEQYRSGQSSFPSNYDRQVTSYPRPTQNFASTSQQRTEEHDAQLVAIQEDINWWKDGFVQRLNYKIEDLTKQIVERHNQVDMVLMEKARRFLDIDQLPVCSDSIVAIDFLLSKLRGEIDTIKGSLNPVNSRNRQTLQPIPSPASTLAKIQQLSSRLNALGVELSTEMSDNCSAPLVINLDTMTKEIRTLETNEGTRWRDVVVRDTVQDIVSGRFKQVKVELAEITVGTTTVEVDLVMQEIINKTMSQGFPANFQNLLGYLKMSNRQYFKSGMKFLIETMKSGGHIDSNQFLMLGYESKGAFGSELKNLFPVNFQQLIWGGTLCIRNKFTNQFLVSNRIRNPGNNRQAESNSTKTGRSRATTISPSRNTNKILVHTAKLKETGMENNEKDKNEFCGWELYPLVAEDSLHYIIRQQINDNWEWNLNVDDLTNTIQISPTNVNPHFTWEICPQEQGQYFSFSSIKPAAEINDDDQTPTLPPLNNFLCSKPPGLLPDRRDVVINSSLDNYCKWHLENPFEMQGSLI